MQAAGGVLTFLSQTGAPAAQLAYPELVAIEKLGKFPVAPSLSDEWHILAPSFSGEVAPDEIRHVVGRIACIVDSSLSSRRVVRELSAIAERRGLPCTVFSDNGTELTSHAVLA